MAGVFVDDGGKLLVRICRSGTRSLGTVLIVTMFAALQGCTPAARLPAVPVAQATKAEILGIENVRFYPDNAKAINDVAALAYQRRNLTRSASASQTFLAISGGGDDGAFGAGLLVGWGDRGDRPVFDVVTGVSTGALAAPFAFLGPEYDRELRAVYTQTNANDIFDKRAPVLSAIAADALLDTAPLRRLISGYVDDAMVRGIAEQYKKGRLLFILTTNLDQGRPVIWNIGAIAESQHATARQLITDILLASASIPAVFPPVMIDVTVDGKQYQEMHVDGGTVAQAFLYPPSISLRSAAARLGISAGGLRVARKRSAYIIRNGRQSRPEADIKLQTLAIAKQALATMTASSGVNDIYRMYLTTQRDGVDFNLAMIGADFDVPYKGPFDPQYMGALFDYGYAKGRAGFPWQKLPPGYAR